MKRIFSVILTVLMLAALVPAAHAEFFPDVPADSYYYDAVQWAVVHDITNGTDKGFEPDTVCTRAQVVTFLWRAKGEPEPKADRTFADVDEDPNNWWYRDAVCWAVEKGITNGTGEFTFSPERKCSVKEILTLIWRAEDSPEAGAPSPLTEGWEETNDKYYAGAVSWADMTGMLDGLGDFDKDADCTRALTVTYLYRMETSREEVNVSSVKELIDAVGPNRSIHLAAGEYNLAEYIKAYGTAGNDYVSFEFVGQDEEAPYELVISGVRNLDLYGAGAEETKIVTSPRYADVITFRGSSGITLDGFTAGHTPEGHCEGGVLNFEDCSDVGMSRLDLYGCGTYGVKADGVEGLELSYSAIHDCTYGIMELFDVTGAVFMDCTFTKCREFDMLSFNGTTAEFNYCTFTENTWDDWWGFVSADTGSRVTFDYCTFDLDAYRSIVNSNLYGKSLFVTNQTTV